MLRQQQALLGTEGVDLEFAPDAVQEIAALAEQVTVLSPYSLVCDSCECPRHF